MGLRGAAAVFATVLSLAVGVDVAAAAEGGDDAGPLFSVLQFNVWNFDSSVENGGLPWKPERVQKIAELVRGLEPPPAAIAWNEIRRHTRPVVSDGNEPEKHVVDDMLEDLANLLPEFAQHSHYVMGEDYGDTQEGIGLFSRFPISAFESFPLALGGRNDGNHRACLRAALDIPGHGELNVFVTHFSYDRSQQLSNVNEIKDIVAKYPVPQVLMGDLNVYIDYDEPMRELMRRDASEGGGVLFRDAWLEAHPHPVELTGKTKDQIAEALGYSFSSWDPHNRADRILVRGPGVQVSSMKVIGHAASKKVAASDHMALFATFELQPVAGANPKASEYQAPPAVSAVDEAKSPKMRGAARGSLQRYSAVPSAAAQAGRVWDDTASASQGDVVEKRQGPSGGLSGSRRAKPRRMLGTFSVIVFVVASAVAVALVAMRSGKRGKCQTLLRALGLGSIVSAFTNKVHASPRGRR